MTLIINPGSKHRGGEPSVAKERAQGWLESMRDDGIVDVELLDAVRECDDGNWEFTFRHTVTGKECHLETHGFYKYREHYTDHGFVFCPREYWNGSSIGDVKIEDFLIEGYRVAKRIEKIT